MDIETIKQQTYELIDRLKKTTVDNGLAGGGNEYTVIIETFLYKFLNDKFIYEAKKEKPELVQAEDFFAALDALSEDDYEEMCDLMLDTIILKKEHLIPFLAKRQNEDVFAELFDSTLESIAKENEEIFYILNDDETKVSIMKPLSDVVSGGAAKKMPSAGRLLEMWRVSRLKMHSRQGTISSRLSSNILSRTTMPTEEETMQSIIHLTPSHPLWRSCL